MLNDNNLQLNSFLQECNYAHASTQEQLSHEPEAEATLKGGPQLADRYNIIIYTYIISLYLFCDIYTAVYIYTAVHVYISQNKYIM